MTSRLDFMNSTGISSLDHFSKIDYIFGPWAYSESEIADPGGILRLLPDYRHFWREKKCNSLQLFRKSLQISKSGSFAFWVAAGCPISGFVPDCEFRFSDLQLAHSTKLLVFIASTGFSENDQIFCIRMTFFVPEKK